MDPARGFISLARSFDQSDIFQNEKWLKVFLWCLIQANHKDKNMPVKTGRSMTVVKVKRGQFIFGRNKAAERLNMSPSTVRNIMEKLQALESISMQKDNHYSIITICNYDEYQNKEFYKGQPTDNQRTTNGQPTDTTNKPNTPNNDNKKNTTDDVEEIFEFWTLTMGKEKSILTEKREKNVRARLKEGYSVDQIKESIIGCSKDPFSMGENDRKKKFDDLELICRNGEKLESFFSGQNVEQQKNGHTKLPSFQTNRSLKEIMEERTGSSIVDVTSQQRLLNEA